MDQRLYNEYIRRVTPKPEDDPNFIGPIKPPSPAQKILGGLESALSFLNTGQGGQLKALLVKNPELQAQIVAQSRAKIPGEQAAESEAKKLEMEKTKSIGDLLAQQAAIEQQNKVLEATLARNQEEVSRKAKEEEQKRQEKLEAEIKETAKSEQDQLEKDYDDYKAQVKANEGIIGKTIGSNILSKEDYKKLRDEAKKRGF